jgi:hypothetical protein
VAFFVFRRLIIRCFITVSISESLNRGAVKIGRSLAWMPMTSPHGWVYGVPVFTAPRFRRGTPSVDLGMADYYGLTKGFI